MMQHSERGQMFNTDENWKRELHHTMNMQRGCVFEFKILKLKFTFTENVFTFICVEVDKQKIRENEKKTHETNTKEWECEWEKNTYTIYQLIFFLRHSCSNRVEKTTRKTTKKRKEQIQTKKNAKNGEREVHEQLWNERFDITFNHRIRIGIFTYRVIMSNNSLLLTEQTSTLFGGVHVIGAASKCLSLQRHMHQMCKTINGKLLILIKFNFSPGG